MMRPRAFVLSPGPAWALASMARGPKLFRRLVSSAAQEANVNSPLTLLTPRLPAARFAEAAAEPIIAHDLVYPRAISEPTRAGVTLKQNLYNGAPLSSETPKTGKTV